MKLQMEKPVYGGDSLAHLPGTDGKPGGKAVFVPLTLPGETVRVHSIEEKRTFARAELDEILNPSPNRVAPGCAHFGSCGGCQYQHADHATQLAWKQQILRETLARSVVAAPAEIGVLAANPWAYRNRIRLAITGNGSIGYRGRRSHEIVQIHECPIASPLLLATARQFAAFAATNPCPAPLTELELFTNPDESQLLLTLGCESSPSTDVQGWLADLKSALPDSITGIRIQLADGHLEAKILASLGESSLSYVAAGTSYRVDQGAFFQVNRWLVDSFVALVAGEDSGKSAWDLFAGVGLFARQLARSFESIHAVESAPASQAALRHNLDGTAASAVPTSTLEFLRHNRLEREPRPDLIVLDPPRAGLGEETTSLLNAVGAPAMVYVSCDPTTLARDLRALTQERYRIDRITQVDMFPQTFHMETVVHLSRS